MAVLRSLGDILLASEGLVWPQLPSFRIFTFVDRLSIASLVFITFGVVKAVYYTDYDEDYKPITLIPQTRDLLRVP